MTGPDREDLSFDPEFLTRIGEAIRARRAAIGMTQNTLAEQTGPHRTGIGKIERGENAPNVVTLKRVAIALKIRATDLVATTEDARGPATTTWRRRRGRGAPDA